MCPMPISTCMRERRRAVRAGRRRGRRGGPRQPIQITASQGIQWQQGSQVVIATGNAKAVRGAVTVTADQLIAHYRKKPGAPSATPAPPPAANAPTDPLNQGGAELYELD